jgi:hypothetical protein
MASLSPLALVKEKFGDKQQLVAALEKLTGEDLWVSRTNAGKGLAHVSNAKLLRLHATFSEVKDKFGTREKLIDALLELEKRTKDAGYRRRLSEWPVPRLYDAYKSAAKRVAASAKPVGTKKAEAKATKSDKAAAPAAKKVAAKPAKKAGAKSAKKASAKSTKKAR